MYVLVCFKLNEKGIQSSKVIHGACSVQIKYRGEGEAKEEKVRCSSCQPLGIEARELGYVRTTVKKCVEPIHPAFMAVSGSVFVVWSEERAYSRLP